MSSSIARILIIAVIALSPVAFVNAGKAAPGIEKKIPPVISSVEIYYSGNTVTISWETSVPTEGSMFIEDMGFVANFGVHHQVTLPFVPIPGQSYLLTAFNKQYGSASFTGVF